MKNLTTEIWIGDSKDAEHADLKKAGITAIINVAHDLQGRRGWSDGITYAQCGLVDGPGNLPAAYHAAALMLAALVESGKRVLVCDHSGGRSLAVAIFYLNLKNPRGWDGWMSVLRERQEIAEPHPEHKKAFNKVNWRLLASVLEG
jgi:hypothetical protein